MPHISVRLAGALAIALVVGFTVVGGATGSAGARQVEALDACDPVTFNGPGGPGPGTCNRPGGGSLSQPSSGSS